METAEWWQGQGYRQGEAAVRDIRSRPRVIALPHSCDEWVIGGPDEARQMIADLEAAIAEWDSDE